MEKFGVKKHGNEFIVIPLEEKDNASSQELDSICHVLHKPDNWGNGYFQLSFIPDIYSEGWKIEKASFSYNWNTKEGGMILKDADGVTTDWISLSIKTGGSQKGQPSEDNLFFMAQLLRDFREISQKYPSALIYNTIQKNKEGWVSISTDEENERFFFSKEDMISIKEKIAGISEIYKILMSRGDINSLKLLAKAQEDFIHSIKKELFKLE